MTISGGLAVWKRLIMFLTMRMRLKLTRHPVLILGTKMHVMKKRK